MQIAARKITLKIAVSSVAVFLLGVLVFLPPALVNEAPFWDDKAYINNALIASGRLNPQDARGPFAEERQPLFWWMLTGVYLLNAPVEYARLLSPLLTAAATVVMFLLVSKLFKSLMAGILSSVFTIALNYFVQTTSYILTDASGSMLAFLALLSFSLGLRYGPFLWVSGGLTAVSILARDQNLLLLPVMLLSMGWIARVSKTMKILYLALLGAVAAAAVVMRQEVFLQMLSDALTPLVTDPVYIPLLIVFTTVTLLAVHKVHQQKNLLSKRPSVEERAFDLLLGLAIMLFIMHPFFLDNVRLGDEFQIAGRGVLSRPVAHSIMVRDDIARSGLTFLERVQFWVSAFPSLLTVPLLTAAVAGAILALKNRIEEAKPLILWFALTVAYIILFTHIEYRFLAPAVQPAAALAAYAITRVRKRWLAFIAAGVILVYVVFPTQLYGVVPEFSEPVTVLGWRLMLEGGSGGWLTDYAAYLRDVQNQPQLKMPITHLLAAWTTFPLLLAAVYVGVKNPL